MKKLTVILGLSLVITGNLSAEELSIRAGNLLRYARGQANQSGSTSTTTKSWFENITKLSLDYANLQLNLTHSLFQPSEFGEVQGRLNAIDFKQLEYQLSNLKFTLGDFYATTGRGLALNLYEDYSLNFDSKLEGFKAELNTKYLYWLALRGRSFPSLSPEGSRVRENDYEGAVVKVSPYSWGNLAGYFFYTPDTTGINAPSQSYPETRMPGGFLNLTVAGVGLFAETAQQYVRESDQKFKHYYGHYLSLDYAGPGYGVVLDYKDYRFKKFGSYSTGSQISSEPLAYQNPPIVQREFTTNLLSKHPHIPLFDDEVGFQIESTFQPSEPLALMLNFSRSSSHREASPLPSLHEEDSPFWQVFAEGEYTFPKNHTLRLDAGYNEEVKVAGQEPYLVTYFWQRKLGFAAEGTYYLNPIKSFSGHLEALHLEDVKDEESFWEGYLSMTFSRAPWGSFTVSLETSGDNDENHPLTIGETEILGPTLKILGQQSAWLSAELDVNFLQKHNLLLFVGQDRGGIKCTSGRCRYVDPFEGVKITLKSTL